jgi:Flp pilus assembly protein TadG
MAQVNGFSRTLKNERGAELIEFALIFPLLLLVLLGIADFGFLFQRYEVLTNATREGARLASLPAYTNDDVKRRVCEFLTSGGIPTTGCPGTSPTNPVISVTIPAPIDMGVGKAPVQVRSVQLAYTHNFMFIGPIVSLMGGSWTNAKTITTVAIMRMELPPTP